MDTSYSRMVKGVCLEVLDVVLVSLLLCSVTGLLLMDRHRDAEDDQELNKAILEMLHINRVSASHQAKAHPYMKRVYQQLVSLDPQDFERSDGTMVQSFHSVAGPDQAPTGWIWFNVSSLKPSMLRAELVMFRKTLHPRPLSVTVTLHSVTASQGALQESPALEERQLNLDQRPSSGYDVFDVSAVLAVKLEAVGFQLRYTDESGSLVLHEALTQSLYCLNRGSLSEPLLVLYQAHPLHI
uniref:TGF-beta propeptide domain-containing protein n=1 Tax=Mastacembelus armatus TaxID=205130 RepID=A0A3Q3L1I4_9TELE